MRKKGLKLLNQVKCSENQYSHNKLLQEKE
jgi:hypothetical protein